MGCQLSVILGPFAKEGMSVQDVETCRAGYSLGWWRSTMRRWSVERCGSERQQSRSLIIFCKRIGWPVKPSLEAPAMRLCWTALTSALIWKRTASSSSISQTVKVLRKSRSKGTGGSPRQRSQLSIGSIREVHFLMLELPPFPSLWYVAPLLAVTEPAGQASS